MALGLLVLWGALRRRRQRAAPTASTGSGAGFDPDRVAHFEAAGWRAYYERDWLRLLRLLVAVSQEQFRIPFPRSLLAAYHVTRAAPPGPRRTTTSAPCAGTTSASTAWPGATPG